MSCDLSNKKCSVCAGATAALDKLNQQELLQQVPEWSIIEGHHLQRDYTFKNFKAALAHVNQVGAIAEEEGHHPNISFTWGKVRIEIWTHSVDGLTEADFILAAKIDEL